MVVISTLLLLLCAPRAKASALPHLRIAGSSTVKPVAEQWQNALLPNYTITLEGGGSSSGARRVCLPPGDPEHVDIGDMSREWKTSEAQLLDDGYTYECLESGNRVTQIMVAIDGLAVAIKRDSAAHACIDTIGGLTLAQLRWIFSDWSDAELEEDGVSIASCVPNMDDDAVKEWSDLDVRCEETPINPYGAGDQSGTHDFFGETVLGDFGGTEYFPVCDADDLHYLEGLDEDAADLYIQSQRTSNCVMPSEDDHLLLQWLLADTGGIAYFGYAYFAQFTDTVAAIAIAKDTELGVAETLLAKIAPDSESIVDGSYSAFKRDLYMNVYNNAWNVSGDFLLFGFSPDGQDLVEETGYVTVNRDQHADMSVRIGVGVMTGGNLEADYVPVPPDSCAVGSGLISWEFTNEFGNDKIGYACESCTAGTVKNNDESSPCDPCPPGFFTNETGQTTCEPCPHGTAATEHGSNSCSMCSLNEHQPLPGQGSCLACSAGRFTELPGQSTCMSCALGTYMPPGGNYTCEACPAGMTTIYRAATAKESCKCAEGTYLAEGGGLDGPCVDCPVGMQCAFGSTFSNFFAVDGSLKAASDDDQPFPVVEEGYMTRIDDLLRVFKCKDKSHCPGGAPATCARGRDSGEVACARCEDYTYEEGEECHACEANATWLVVLACFVAVVAVCVGTISVNRNLLMQTSSTLMCVIMASQMFLGLQTFSVFTFFSLEWFEPLRGMLKIMSLISFDLKILRISCSMGSNPTSNYALRQFVAPLAVPWICGTVAVKKQFDPKTMHFREAVNTIGTVFQVFFISIVLSASAPLVFYDHPNNAGSSLVSDPAVLYFESNEHYSMLAVGILAMVMVPLPFLSFVLYGTLKYPKYAAVGADTDFFGFASFRFLFFRFKPSRYYYGLIMLVRNLFLCLVPVVIESDVAAQVIITSVLILATMVLQVELAPWKLAAANYADAACSSTLLMVLICGAMAANVDVQNSSIPAFASVLVGFFFAVGAVLVVASVFYYFKPFPTYAFFICHHREGAQAQARLLKMILTSKTGKPVLTDTDDLMQLDSLFDTVKTQVHHLVVYLTRDTLSRPWCAGEIVTALMWRRRVTAVVTDSFVPPNEVDYADMAKYLDLSSCSLNAFGITNDSVVSAYRSLMSDDVKKVHMRSDLKGMTRFEDVTNFLSDGQAANAASIETGTKASSEALPGKPRAVLISSEPGNDEALAAALILLQKIQPQLKGLVPEGVRVIDEYARDEGAILRAVEAARALLVLLSPGTLAAPEQITAIEQIMLSIEKAENAGLPPPAAVSICLPGFQVPSDEFYSEKVRRVSQGQKSATLIRSFFQQGAVHFSVGASEQTLDAQVSEVVLRVPRSGEQEGPEEREVHGAEEEHRRQGHGGSTAADGEGRAADGAPREAGPPAGPQPEAGQGGGDSAPLQI